MPPLIDLLPSTDARYVLHDKGFTRTDIALKKGKSGVVSGRALNDKALAVVANYKLALKFHNEFMQEKGTKFPSGKNIEDLCLHIREEMFVFLKGGKVIRERNF